MSCWEFSPSVWSSSFKSETNMKMYVKHLLFYYYYYYFLNYFSVALFFTFNILPLVEVHQFVLNYF